MLDAAHEAAEGHFHSLEPGFTPQVPVGADLKRGPGAPARPGAGAPVPRPPALRARGQEVGLREGARRGARRPRGSRTAGWRSSKPLRPVIKLVANPLGLGHMGEQYFVLEKSWQTHFNRQLAAEKASAPTVGEAAAVDGPAEARRAWPVSRQPADPGLRRADQPRLLLERPAVPEPDARQPPRRHGAAAAGPARRGRVGGGATPGEGGLRARRLRRGAAHGRERRGPGGQGPGAGRAASGSRATTWPARSGCRWPGWASRTRRSPRPRAGGPPRRPRPCVAGLVGKDATAALKHLAAGQARHLGRGDGARAWRRPPGCSTPSTAVAMGDCSTRWPRSTARTEPEADETAGRPERGPGVGRVRRGPGAAPRFRADAGDPAPEAEEAPDHADSDDRPRPRHPARRMEDDRARAGSDHAGQLGGPDREAQGPPGRRRRRRQARIHWSLQKKGPR